jgi:SPP1 gp7 family putative phage head morphogenesis protein
VRKRVPKQAFPDALEREYVRKLVALVDVMHVQTKAAIIAALPRADAEDDPGAATIGRAIEGVKVDVFKQTNKRRAGLIAQGVGGKVVRFTDRAVGAQVKAVIGVDSIGGRKELSPALLDQFVKENVKLIKTVPKRYFRDVEKLARDSVTQGTRTEDFLQALEERYGVSKFNATRIARDQIGKLNSAVTGERHKALGITHYFWRTNKDERVRESHAAKEGQRFANDDPPSDTGHPGEDIQCRCDREPDLTVLF